MQNRTKGFRILGAFLASAGVIAFLAGCGATSGAAIVATFNGGSVTESQLDEQVNLEKLLNPNLNVSDSVKKVVAQQYIVYERLLVQKAEQAGIQVSSNDVQQSVLGFKQQIIQQLYSGSQSSFDAKMQSLNLTDSDLADFVRVELILRQYSNTLSKSTPLAAQQSYYKQNIAKYTTGKLRQILVKSLPLAEKITNELRNGGSWTVLAKQYSQDPGSKDNGGEYIVGPAPNLDLSQTVPSFEQHALTQPVGVVGAPFQSPYGYHIVLVEQRNTLPFSAVQAQIISTLKSQQGPQALNALVSQLQKTANIKVTLPS